MKRPYLRTIVLGVVLLSLFVLDGSTVQGASDYIVRADDKLKIKIFQYPELSGDYTVSSVGTISIAPIGEVSVDGATIKEISTQISDRFIRAGLSDRPGTTVEVLQSRPIYVLGDVQKPGDYPYRPGVTVLQLISVAGGWLRFNDVGLMRLERDAINIKGDMRTLVTRYYHLLAQRARLNAELALKTDVEFPPELIRQAENESALAQLINEERSFLSIHVEAFKNQLASLETTRALYEREIEGVTRQIQANKVQYDSVQKELSEVKALFTRGLTPITRQMSLDRMQAQIEMTEQGFITLILRARQGIAQVDQKISDLNSERSASLTAELQRTRLDLGEIGIKFETSQSLLAEAQLTTPSMISGSDDMIETRSLTIVRVEEGKAVTFDAEEHTPLLPGDVLRVKRSIVPSAIGIAMRPRNVITPTAGKY